MAPMFRPCNKQPQSSSDIVVGISNLQHPCSQYLLTSTCTGCPRTPNRVDLDSPAPRGCHAGNGRREDKLNGRGYLLSVDLGATLLQSSKEKNAWQYGVSDPFWYAFRAKVRVLLFGVLAIEVSVLVLPRWGMRHMSLSLSSLFLQTSV